MISALSTILPPPDLLTMPCAGVDVSDSSLKYVQFAPPTGRSKERLVRDWGEISIPSGVMRRGQVEDPEGLAKVLSEFKDRTGAELIRLSLPEERAYLFETEVRHDVPEKEMVGLLEFKLEENVPIPSREVSFDYQLLATDESSRTQNVVVAAYAHKTIDTYYEVCAMADLFPVSFEVEAQAMVRAVVPEDSSGAVMVVDFGKNRTGIGIAYHGVLMYTSTIELGGDHLSERLREELGENVGGAEITTIKNTQGLLPSQCNPNISKVLESVMEEIRSEIETRMQYWHLRSGNEEERMVHSVVLCGGTANLRGLPQFFSKRLGMPCVRGDVWQRAFSTNTHVPPIDRHHSYGYATAIGLALGDDI